MTIQGRTPVVARRALRLKLRRARRALDKTQAEVAGALDWHSSKIMRIEKGDTAISVSDLIALLTEYPSLEPERDLLLQLARESKSPPTVNKFSDVLTLMFMMWLEYEPFANRIRQFEPTLVPGVLQTDAIATAIVTILLPPSDPRDPARIVAARRERINSLMHPEGPPMEFIIDEAALRRAVGNEGGTPGFAPMREQLSQIQHYNTVGRTAMGEPIEPDLNPNVSVQIVPFSAGAYRAMRDAFEIIEFDEGDEADQFMLYRETSDDEVFREEYDLIEAYVREFDTLKKTIPGAAETNRRLDQIVAELPQ